MVLFILSILDRQNIAAGRLGGLEDDLGMNDTQYQTSVAIMVRNWLFLDINSPTDSLFCSVRGISRWSDS